VRLFVALAIPESVAQSLLLLSGGVPGARWQTCEQLHLTLRFIGEVEGSDRSVLDDALARIDAPAFDLQLHSVGQFGNKQPQSLWSAARPNDMLDHLQRKVDNAIRRVGQPQDAHKFTPHVTLARLHHPDTDRMVDWLKYHALYTSAEFPVDAFHLWSSKLTSDGSIYRIEKSYDLRSFGNGEIGD
jgi:2'-5' RNA ligase